MRSVNNIVERLQALSAEPTEQTMKQWDHWRRYIAEGGGGSWPRDDFEGLMDEHSTIALEARTAITQRDAVIRELVEALEPFAVFAEAFFKMKGQQPRAGEIYTVVPPDGEASITVEMLRATGTALERAKEMVND